MRDDKRKEILKDRRAYREALINRREEIERKINHVEKQIRALKGDG